MYLNTYFYELRTFFFILTEVAHIHNSQHNQNIFTLFNLIQRSNVVTRTKAKSNYRGYDQNPAIQNFLFIFSLIILM